MPAPIEAGRRWVIERTRALGNQHEFWLALASAAIICGRLVHRAWTHYR